VPDHSHEARHRAGKNLASRRQTTSRPSRILTGLALPTAATVALMFCAAGAAVATSPRTPKQIFNQSAAALASPQATTAETGAKRAHLLAVERAQAAATASALQEIDRATEVVRSDKRKKLGLSCHNCG
jgi:hypothetical protein